MQQSSEDYYRGGVVSVWEPVGIGYNARCDACGKMNRQSAPITRCSACGATLSLPENTW